MARRAVVATVVILVACAVFGARYWAGTDQAAHPSIFTADGYVGTDQASFMVGDTYYGFEGSIPWPDRAGVVHNDQTGPACLPKLAQVSGARFTGAVIAEGEH